MLIVIFTVIIGLLFMSVLYMHNVHESLKEIKRELECIANRTNNRM